MAIQRMEHIGVVVEDLDAAIAFFVDLGMELEGRTPVEGDWVDRVVGLEGVRVDIAVVRTPGGQGKLELTRFHSPQSPPVEPSAPANTPGIRHLLFAVDDLDATLARLRPHGADLVGEVTEYANMFRLCYVRGPEGIIIELSESIG